MSNQDRFNVQTQLEHLQQKHVGTGHPDMTKFEWAVQQQRDTYSSIIGHQSLLNYLAIAENESCVRMKQQFLDRMYEPCGKAPEKEKMNE